MKRRIVGLGVLLALLLPVVALQSLAKGKPSISAEGTKRLMGTWVSVEYEVLSSDPKTVNRAGGVSPRVLLFDANGALRLQLQSERPLVRLSPTSVDSSGQARYRWGQLEMFVSEVSETGVSGKAELIRVDFGPNFTHFYRRKVATI
jgi:hypothetical protein